MGRGQERKGKELKMLIKNSLKKIFPTRFICLGEKTRAMKQSAIQAQQMSIKNVFTEQKKKKADGQTRQGTRENNQENAMKVYKKFNEILITHTNDN